MNAYCETDNNLPKNDASFLSNFYPFPSYLYDLSRKYIWLVPLLLALLIPVYCIVFYSIAAYYGHLQTFLMYISDAGTFKPTAGFFAFGIDMIAIGFFITFYSRYKQCQYYLQVKLPQMTTNNNTVEANPELMRRLQFVNSLSFLFASLLVFSMMAVATFRCDESFLFHALSTFAMFSCMFVYASLSIYLCNHLWTHWHIESRPVTMTIWFVFGQLLMLAIPVFNVLASQNGNYADIWSDITPLLEHRTLHFWKTDEPGFPWHVLSAASDWTLINSAPIFLFCLCQRMRAFTDWLKVEF